MDLEKELLEMIIINARNTLDAKKIEIISEETLIKAVPVIIETVERAKTKGITGVKKKQLVLKVLMLIVNESMILDDEKKELLKSVIEGGTLEMTIDLIVDASKGKFELNRKTRNKLYLCLAACFSRLGRNKNTTHDDSDGREKSERVVKLEPMGDNNEGNQQCNHDCSGAGSDEKQEGNADTTYYPETRMTVSTI